MSRPRLIETQKFWGCRDRDSPRLRNFGDVETETTRDWPKDVETETLSRVSLISGLCLAGLSLTKQRLGVVKIFQYKKHFCKVKVGQVNWKFNSNLFSI